MGNDIKLVIVLFVGLVMGYFAQPPNDHLLHPASPAFSGTTTTPYRIVPAGKFINFEYIGFTPTGDCSGPENNISLYVYPEGIAVCQGGASWRHVQFDE